jgi:hypothetical protein
MAFLKSIGKAILPYAGLAAAPFTGGMSALAAGALKTGLGVGGGLLASKLMGGKTDEEKAALLAQQNAMDASGKLATDASGRSTGMLDLAGKSFNPVVDYWSKILSGNRGAATSMLAPELNRISDQYKATTESASELLPRGGGRATMLGDLPYQQMRDQQTLLQTARPQAATGLVQVGGATASSGNSLVSNAVNALNAGTTAGRNMLAFSADKREQDRKFGSGIGKSIFDLLKGVKFGKGGGGTLADSPIPMPGVEVGLG